MFCCEPVSPLALWNDADGCSRSSVLGGSLPRRPLRDPSGAGDGNGERRVTPPACGDRQAVLAARPFAVTASRSFFTDSKAICESA